MPAPLSLRTRTGGGATASVRDLHGRQVVWVEIGDERPSRLRTVDTSGAATVEDGIRHALRASLPVLVVVRTTALAGSSGVDGLHAWGRTARALVAASGRVPVLALLDGPALGSGALVLGLADVCVVTRRSTVYLSGPRAVQTMTGVPISRADLGGAGVHAASGLGVGAVADDLEHGLDLLADVLDHLPDSTDDLPDRRPGTDDPDRPTPELRDVLPATATGSYDVRDVLGAVADDGALCELRADWAPNLVTALARIDGHPVGFVANQPSRIAGTLDIPASQKGARFVAWCDAFNVALVTVVDTPGFYPGKDQEWRGMIRHGAQMAFAYARASVPRISLTLRKSYGGAYIVMDSARMGCDLVLAWPTAEIAVMGARGAVEILHRRAGVDERAQLEREYEERLLNPWVAAERGLVDAVIDPSDTRRELAAALGLLGSKRELLAGRSHDNTPL